MKLDALLTKGKTIIKESPLDIDIGVSFVPSNMWVYVEFECVEPDNSISNNYALYKIQNYYKGSISYKSYHISVDIINVLEESECKTILLYCNCFEDGDVSISPDMTDTMISSNKRILFDYDELKLHPRFKDFSITDIASYIAQGNHIPNFYEKQICLERCADERK